MNTSEFLDSLLALFREKVTGADFLRAWREAGEIRRLARPVVVGEVKEETIKPGSLEVKYQFRIFLPEGRGAPAAEGIFAAMCAAAGQAYPGFSAISRGAADRDRATGLLAVTCALSFLSQTGGGEPSSPGRAVKLGGREYLASGVKTTVSRKGRELISVGETVPFAVADEETEYLVELEGLDVSGLENLAGFTAELEGSPKIVYLDCRWKSLSDALRKASFVSRRRESL